MRLPAALLLLVFLAASAQGQVINLPPIDTGNAFGEADGNRGAVRSQPISLSGSPSTSEFDSESTYPTSSPIAPNTGQARKQPLPLAPRSEKQPLGRSTTPQTPTGALTTVMASLAIVLGLFFVVVWITRRALPKASTTLPGEVVEVLGRSALSGRQHLQVVRFGHKLLLVSVTAGGATTLTEITDVDEVERIAGLCREGQPGSISATFRQVLSQFANEPAPGGFLGEDSSEAAVSARDRATPR